MDTKEIAGQLLSNIRGSLTAAANKFLEENAPVKAFIEAKVARSAELVVEYAKADEDNKPHIKQYMTVVYQTIRNETLAVLLKVDGSVKDTILGVLSSAFQFALQNLPTILALIPK